MKDESYLSFRVESWDSSKTKYYICLAFANTTTINLFLVLCINQFGNVSKGWPESSCIVIASKVYKAPKYEKWLRNLEKTAVVNMRLDTSSFLALVMKILLTTKTMLVP